MNWRKKSKKDWGRLDLNYKETPFGKIPEHWGVGTILENSKLVTDYVANGSFASLKENVQYKNEPDYAILIRLVDFNNEFDGNFVYLSRHSYDFLKKSKLFGNEIIISNVGANVGTVFKAPSLSKPMSLGPNSIMFIPKGDNDFYYYWMKSRFGQHMLKSIVSGSAQPKFNKTDFRRLEIPVPPINEQKEIGSILRSLDDRIAENKKINHHLAEMAESIWKEKYANLKPNSTLGNFFPIITGKKDANVARGGQYPFFSCSQGISYTDAYSFEGNAILLAGNGDFNVKTYNGKFEAYQRTYVLIPNNEYRLGFLYYAIKHFLSDITAGDRGSVIKYITKGDIENLNLYMPDDESDFELFNQFVSNTAQNNAEIERLTETRDTLLPKLMSGELSVID